MAESDTKQLGNIQKTSTCEYVVGIQNLVNKLDIILAHHGQRDTSNYTK